MLAHKLNTIMIFKNTNKGCKDTYNIVLSKKKEQLKQFINRMMEVIDIVNQIGGNYQGIQISRVIIQHITQVECKKKTISENLNKKHLA